MNTETANVPAVAAEVRQIPSAKKSLVVRIAEQYNVDPTKLLETLKATAFRQRADRKTGEVREPTDAEMMVLLILADQYSLNPFTKELFAYLDPKSQAIIPVVSVDGWIRIINAQPTLRSLSFKYSDDTVKHKGKTCHAWMECEIVRSDRDKPITIREYFAEVVREVDFATPWDSHPNRMHRHKVLIQTARVAFGFGGIHDDDEAARIMDGEQARVAPLEVAPGIASINAAVQARAQPAPALENHGAGLTVPPPIVGGSVRVPETIDANPETNTTKAETTAAASDPAAAPVFADVAAKINAARTLDDLNVAVDLIRSVENKQHQRELNLAAADRRAAITSDDGK